MSGRVPKDPRLTRAGIMAEEAELRREREELRQRVQARYRGRVGEPRPGEFDDLLADSRTDWAKIEEESSSPD